MDADLDISRRATLQPIEVVAAKLGISGDALHPYGHFVAKLDEGFISGLSPRPDAKLILVTAISPTPAGEGKTTTTVGLGDALNRIGKRAVVCLREPSLGPCFGQKGGATGGGRAQVAPMERINLHFTGDFHAITSAHNLLSALLDNHIYWGNALQIDTRRIAWRRALDMNDRSLRAIVSSLGGPVNGFPREDGFDITVASEVMAVFCLARDLEDLVERLGRMIVARTRSGQVVTAADLGVTGAMAVLLKEAVQPNLVQTLENNPALVHGGPFANIAHGCNSVIATRAALGLGDYVVTEAGFGADLGAEKFFNIKCRSAGLTPAAVVIVATIRALKMHGGVGKSDLGGENLEALQRGFANLERHVANLRRFGFDPVIALNHFGSDSTAEMQRLQDLCRTKLASDAILCRHWAEGSGGAETLAHAVVARAESGAGLFKQTYADATPILDKMRLIARNIYGADDIALSARASRQLRLLEQDGRVELPICFAKTQYSFSVDPKLLGAPVGHVVPVEELRLMAGAGFVVALCGEIRTMPGLPREPAALRITLVNGQVEGLS